MKITNQGAWIVVLLAAAAMVRAEVAECVYDNNECSCKFGDATSGICYDLVNGTEASGTCQARYCRAGWTCSCHGRTNLCLLTEKSARIRDGTGSGPTNRQVVGDTIPCHSEARLHAGNGERLRLGSFYPSYSRKGLLDGQCKQLAWWVDGNLIEVYGDDEITESNVDEEMERRGNNTLFPLRPGSVVAFRFKHASYHCFNSFASLRVNGTAVDTNSPAIRVLFNRQHVENWSAPDANITFAEDELSADYKDFLPLRPQTLFDGTPIAFGRDNWKPPDGTEDHKLSNFYFRIEL